jgi:glucose/arabinose dehydrogenase
MRHIAHTLAALALLSAGCSDDDDQGTLPQGAGGSGTANANGTDNGNGNDASNGSEGPTVSDPKLSVRTVVSGLTQPIGLAFLAENDFFVTEKTTGMVKRVVDGQVTDTVLDLPVNSFSERGLLGIALHPHFASNGWAYLYWTESSSGEDSEKVDDVGNPALALHAGYAAAVGQSCGPLRLGRQRTHADLR